MQAALVVLVLVLAAVLPLAASPSHAAERTPAEATAHALEELANGIAQGRVTLTPTPSPTLTPTPTALPTETPTAEPTESPTPTPTPEPCWQRDDLGDIVFDDDGSPVPCSSEPVVAVEPESGGPTLEPTATATPLPPPTTAPAPQQAGPQVVYVQQPAQIVYVVVTPPPAATATLTPTRSPTLTTTPIATRTASPAPTASPTRTATLAPTTRPTSTPAAVGARSTGRANPGESFGRAWDAITAPFRAIGEGLGNGLGKVASSMAAGAAWTATRGGPVVLLVATALAAVATPALLALGIRKQLSEDTWP